MSVICRLRTFAKEQMSIQWKVKKYVLAGIHEVELYTFRAYGQVARLQ